MVRVCPGGGVAKQIKVASLFSAVIMLTFSPLLNCKLVFRLALIILKEHKMKYFACKGGSGGGEELR